VQKLRPRTAESSKLAARKTPRKKPFSSRRSHRLQFPPPNFIIIVAGRQNLLLRTRPSVHSFIVDKEPSAVAAAVNRSRGYRLGTPNVVAFVGVKTPNDRPLFSMGAGYYLVHDLAIESVHQSEQAIARTGLA
jgi:hypothetical protein